MCERLIALLCKVECKGDDLREGGCGYRQGEKCNSIEKLDMCMLGCIADHLLSNGVIVPPCKVGDTVYLPWKWKDASGIAVLTVERISITESGQSIRTDFWSDDEGYWLAYNCGVYKFDDIGKTVFFTKEEAEKALKGDEGK